MRRPIPIFTGGGSLNTVSDPVRIAYDPESGLSDFAETYNVQVEKDGRLSRVDGYSRIADGAFHSLFCDGGDCFVGKSNALYQVMPDFSLRGIRSGLSGERIAYAQRAEEIWYCNGTQNGVIIGGVSNPCPVQEYYGTETTREYGAMPVGEHLAWFASRLFVSTGNVLWWSEPYQGNLTNLARNFVRLPHRIRMVKPVAEGLFIGTSKETFFLRGTDSYSFTQERAANYPPLEWSDAIDYVDGFDIGLNEPGLCALWVSAKGACVGTARGQIININRAKVLYPQKAKRGASLFREYHYIQIMW